MSWILEARKIEKKWAPTCVRIRRLKWHLTNLAFIIVFLPQALKCFSSNNLSTFDRKLYPLLFWFVFLFDLIVYKLSFWLFDTKKNDTFKVFDKFIKRINKHQLISSSPIDIWYKMEQFTNNTVHLSCWEHCELYLAKKKTNEK